VVLPKGKRRSFSNYHPRYTGTFPSSISISGSTFTTETYRDVLVRTCEFVQRRKPSEFSKILQLRGRKRKWFSRVAKELHDPVRIPGTDIFVECNVNANILVLRSFQVLHLFGLEPDIEISIGK
jgi:hypothetical protein